MMKAKDNVALVLFVNPVCNPCGINVISYEVVRFPINM
jgi:hypothetical protein